MKSLTKLPITQFSGLDYENIIKDVYNLVRDNPDFNQNWNDFLSSSAGRMFIELFAYIADQLSLRIDWHTNENFLTTASQDKSILKLLKLIDYKLELPHSATVPITIYLSTPTDKEIVFTPAYTELSGVRDNIYTISGPDRLGNIKTFEALRYDEDNNKFLYKEKVSINTGAYDNNSMFSLPFYEGTTRVEQFISSTSDNQKFTLAQAPVINGSVSVFVKRNKESNYLELEEVELLKVENFLENEAQDELTEVPFVVNSLEGGVAEIEFPPEMLMKSQNKILEVGSNLIVFYRTGGGTSGNITTKAINFDRIVFTTTGNAITATFVNQESGYGGTDLETIEHAVLHGPLSLRSVKKAVTVEDYSAVLARNPLVLKSVSYGNNNAPSNFYNRYGVYINPQEVWNFVLLNKNYDNIPPSQYNNYRWMETRLENRFNEKYSFNNSKFNRYCYYYTDMANTVFLNYKEGVSRQFDNYIIIKTTDDFKEALGELDDGNNLILNPYLQFKLSKQSTDELFFNDIGFDFIDNTPKTFGYVEGEFIDRAEEEVNATFISPVYVDNTQYDLNNLYGFDISSKYSIGIDIDGRGMITIELNDDYSPVDNKKIFLTNPNPLIKPPSGTYYNTLFEARYHKGIVEKINYAFANTVSIYGSDARPIHLLGLSLADNSQNFAFSQITSETLIPLTINGNIYNISYGGTGRTSQYYEDIVSYINADLNGTGFTCEMFIMENGFKDIKFTSLVDNTILVEKTESYAEDLLYYLYEEDLYRTPPNPSNGGNYSTVASVVVDTSGKKYLKITSPSTGEISSIQFKVSDFKNDLNSSYEFMDVLGVRFIGNISQKIIGKKSITLITNYNNVNYGNLIYETNILGKDPYEDRFLYLSYIGQSQTSIVVGSNFQNFYAEDPDTYRTINKAHYIYNTVINPDTLLPIMEDSNFLLAFTKEPVTTKSIWNAENNGNKIYMYPYDFIKLKTLDLTVIDLTENYFSSNDILSFSIDGGNLMTIPLSPIHTRLSFINALATAFTNAGYGSYLDYIEYDYDNENILYLKNKKRNIDGKIYFPETPDNNLFFEKIFGTPAQNGLKTFYREGITVHPWGVDYVELTNHPYIDSDYSAQNGYYDAITFDCRIRDENYAGGYRTPDFYYSFDETDRVFLINKVDGNLIPDTEFYLHFVNDRRYNEIGEVITTRTEDEDIVFYLDKYKISSIDNKVLPANFITFDVAATITCKPSFSVDSIRYGLENKLREAFSLSKMGFNENVVKSKIFSEIQNYPGVIYSEITFLGTDFTNPATGVANKIDVDFDTIAVLSEDRYSSGGLKEHGLIFNYIQSFQ